MDTLVERGFAAWKQAVRLMPAPEQGERSPGVHANNIFKINYATLTISTSSTAVSTPFTVQQIYHEPEIDREPAQCRIMKQLQDS